MEDLIKLLENVDTLKLALESLKEKEINITFTSSWKHKPFKILQVHKDYSIVFQSRDSDYSQFLNPIGTDVLYCPTDKRASSI